MRIRKPTIINAAGEPSKRIEEFFGRVNSGTEQVSIARMKSPYGWREPGQTPEFDEYSVVLHGALHVKLAVEEFDVPTGEAVFIPRKNWVQYSTPSSEGAEYISVCLPAFSIETVHRDTEHIVE
jgi:mannose-6-phosphate isomerase-like protein (cupin superfamily)